MSLGELAPLQIELRDMMHGWGCPLCKLSAKAEAAYIASLNYERVLDLKTRDALKASRGLCPQHARQWEDVQGSALGIGIVYRVTVLDLLRATAEAEPSRLPFRRKASAEHSVESLENSGPCPACTIAEGTAARYADLLLKEVGDPEARDLFISCGGLCLSHLRMTLSRPGASRGSRDLLASQRQAWRMLMAELEEFIRKNDYRFVGEQLTEAEASSWYRAVDAVVGLRSRKPM